MLRSKTARSHVGKVVAITGGARGIGFATAVALAGEGASVALGDLDGDRARAAAEGLGVAAYGGHLDVSDRVSFREFIAEVEQRLGPIDVLINNAGIMPLGRILEEDEGLTRKIIDINLHGPIIGTKLVAPSMAARGGGHIINVSSAVGRVALAGAVTYSASKYGLIGFTEAARAELRDSGVEVSCVVPMIVNTQLGAGLSTVKGQRTVEAADVANAIVEVIAKPRFEAWVPVTGRLLYTLMSLVPRRWSEAISRNVGAAHVLDRPDRAARDSYESGVRGLVEDHRNRQQ
ncbi:MULTISPECIES: SDR family oxidoreductase [Nocardia]|uniref:SDR family oxidoreductase n=1 Tax=Nocardia TaxID=1817 RepID=UPI000D68BD66|nr:MULTISPECIES: SDR family oxidoreductase [Nocardia]